MEIRFFLTTQVSKMFGNEVSILKTDRHTTAMSKFYNLIFLL